MYPQTIEMSYRKQEILRLFLIDSMQILTVLDLQANLIDVQGAQYVANMLEGNTVRLFDLLFKFIFLNRHLRC